MRKILDIYKEYKIMPTLQEHMFRVAAVASLLCDNFTKPVNKEDIILACLLHDIGNIVKFHLNYFPEFNKPEGIKYWQKIQDEFIEKYGDDDHVATVAIMKELGVSRNLIFLVDKIDFSLSTYM